MDSTQTFRLAPENVCDKVCRAQLQPHSGARVITELGCAQEIVDV
jgi:hypothetical protein